MTRRTRTRIPGTLLLAVSALLLAPIPVPADDAGPSVANRRLDLMRRRAGAITFRSTRAGFPAELEPEPLFRYDDPTRGYVDGTVWRLGAHGRPLGIITAELHPHYAGRPCIVYDLLSFSPQPFVATSDDFTWSPSGSMLQVRVLTDGPKPAATRTQRMLQMKKLMQRFSATQDVEGELVRLRLLPKPIDRYRPTKHERADATIFLFVNGRNPGILVLLECDGQQWQYAVARLSHPSVLSMSVDDERRLESQARFSWRQQAL